MNVAIAPTSALRGVVTTPGDKSISHRTLMLSALADGESVIHGLSNGEDVRATRAIMSALGAHIDDRGGVVVVRGPREGLHPSTTSLDCGNSGTTIRLLAGFLASVPGTHILVGDESLSSRPMDRIAEPLREMGLSLRGQGDRYTPPLTVEVPSAGIRSIEYSVPVPSAQVKSAVLFAGLATQETTVVRESLRTRANTEEMLHDAGVDVLCEDIGKGRVVRLHGSRPRAHEWWVPGDPSQAAFFAVLAALHPDADVTVAGLYPGPERLGFVAVLQRMGAHIELVPSAHGVNLVARSSDLQGVVVSSEEIPSVDEVPILAVAAAAAGGDTRFVDVGELRIKESDRLQGSVDLVTALGATAEIDGDDLIIHGVGTAKLFRSFSYRAALDHRMVMSAAVAAAVGQGGTIEGAETVSSSFPDFFDVVASLR